MLTNYPSTHVPSHGAFDRSLPNPLRPPLPFSLDQRAHVGRSPRERSDQDTRQSYESLATDAINPAVEISPADIVKRRAVTWDGMRAEVVQVTQHERIEYCFRAPCHLLVVYEQGVRNEGETLVEGLPRSARRDLKRKLTFAPAGHEYREWQDPRTLARMVFFYFDPKKMPVHSKAGEADGLLAPRLFFEDTTLWDTALKLRTLIESAGSDNRLYFEALGTVLAHELVRLNAGAPRPGPQVRGGLAAWQQRTVAAYIEEHLSEQIPLTVLAQLVRLSPYYFCRAFKQSFGLSPHRYHNSQRIELAKTLLAKPNSSVTEVGLAVGFSETSSFTAAFRKTTGFTPTTYRRGLA
jgi:AraC family transcriptional regulator